MDKELFVKTMNQIEELARQQDKLDDMLKEIDPEFGGGYIHNKSIFILEELLAQLTNDKYENIAYYMWEIDFGKEYVDGMITDDQGNNIPLSNAEELYDLIMSSQD